MDDLLREFLTETGEHLDTVNEQLVRFEQHPADVAILRNIFRLVHTIKGTCGFLGLPRLEALAHAAETLLGRLRDGMPVTSEAVTLILETVDRIKTILAELDRVAAEPAGSDGAVIAALELAALGPLGPAASGGSAPPVSGEASLDALEQAFRDAPGPVEAGVAPAPPERARAVAPRSDASEPEAGARTQTIRVAVDTLEHLMTTVSELVLTRNQLLDLARRQAGEGDFKLPLQRLSHVTAELQDGIMKTRMQPVGSAWAKLPRVVRDLAGELGKRFDLVMEGAETELDRQVIELIRDPLTHMIRNSADHGIEPPEERVRRGKSPHGTIRLNAFHEAGTITIEVQDDGRGLDQAAIRRRAIDLGLAPEADIARMSDDRVAQFIFHQGFSTSAKVSAVSGRGVGMDVVKANIGAIGGTVEIASDPGCGARFTIKIPLTLAIIAALIIEVAGQRFALPQVSVVELVRVRPGSAHALERIDRATVVRLRDELLPVVDLGALLEMREARPDPDDGFVVVTQVGRRRFGMLVQAVLETEEIVVKPISSRLKHLAAFSGATIMGDGAVALIIDPNGVARMIGPDLVRGAADLAPARRVAQDLSETLTLLIFRGGGGGPKAVPLSLVTRLEEVDGSAIEEVGGRRCIQYRGRLMPIIDLQAGVGASRGQQALVVVCDADRHLALAVDEIVDIVDGIVTIEPVAGRPDLIGQAIVRGQATEIIDLTDILPRVETGWRPGRLDTARDRTLLLVEGSPFFRDLLTPVLKAAGYRVRVAADEAAALQVLEQDALALIVVDLDLPARDGLDLVAAFRRRPAARDAHIILLASSLTDAILERARSLGVFDIVAKFDRSGLLGALAEAGAERELAA